MKLPFNDRRDGVPADLSRWAATMIQEDPPEDATPARVVYPPQPAADGGVPFSPTGVYRLTAADEVEPADDVAEFRAQVLKRTIVGAKDVTTLFLPMRMSGNTFFEVAVSDSHGTLWIERYTRHARAMMRHAVLVKTLREQTRGEP